MALNETMMKLNSLLSRVVTDLGKANKGNKSAAQRARVGTIDLEKVSKKFRKESVAAERKGKRKSRWFSKKGKRKAKLRKPKTIA